MPNSMLATRISSFEERCFFIDLYAPLVMHLIINVWIRDGKAVWKWYNGKNGRGIGYEIVYSDSTAG